MELDDFILSPQCEEIPFEVDVPTELERIKDIPDYPTIFWTSSGKAITAADMLEVGKMIERRKASFLCGEYFNKHPMPEEFKDRWQDFDYRFKTTFLNIILNTPVDYNDILEDCFNQTCEKLLEK